MAKQILTSLDLLSLPSLTTPKTGSVGFGAKSDGLYQKVGTVETKLSIDGHTHTIAQITGLQGALDAKQPTIPTGTTSQYYRGDKTWQTLNTSVVPEGTNLYFTNARVKAYGDTLYSPLGHTHTIAQITGLQGALDSKATPSDIDTAIDNLEIGGRNLLPLNNLKGYISGNLVNQTSYNVSDNGIISVINNPSNTLPGWKLNVSDGTLFTISGETTSSIATMQCWYRGYDITGNITQAQTSFTFPVVNNKFKHTRNFVLPVDTAYLHIGIGPSYASGVSYDMRIKLEKGNKATDWTPAPEDQVSDWSETDVNSFAFIKNKPTLLSQFTDNIGVGTHIANKANPHEVTKAQVGLGNVDNVKQATKSEFDTHTANNTIHITSTERTNWNDANSKKHTHGNKSVIDALTQGNIDVLSKLSIDANGNLKIDANAYATGELSAYGAGTGGGSGPSYERLDSWADYATGKEGWVLSALLGVDLNNRLSNVESGSATSITTTGSGNAITSVSKSGNTLTFAKGSTFSLSTHNHDTIYKPIGYVPSWSEITGKPSTFAPSPHTLDSHSNVIITENTAGEILKWNGSKWINNTLAEAGIASTAQLANYLPLTGGTLTGDLNVSGVVNTGYIKEFLTNFGNIEDRWYKVATINKGNSGITLRGSLNNHVESFGTQKFDLSFYGREDGNGTNIEIHGHYNSASPNVGIRVVKSGASSYGYFHYDIYIKTTRYTQANVLAFIEGYATNYVDWYGNTNYVTTEPIGELIEFDNTNDAEGYYVVVDSNKVLNVNGTSNVVANNFTGNASTATKLQTARTIWGQSFDGKANVSGALTSVTDITASGTIQGLYGNFTNLSANYLPKQSSNGLVNSIIYDNGTNVGIGTTSPGAKLDVDGVLRSSATYPQMILQTTDDTKYGELAFRNTTGNTRGYVNYNFSADDMKFRTAGTEKMRITSSGNVGIGTTSPAYKLDVAGTGRFTGNVTAPTFSGSLSGNASSATKLQTARTIAGVSFDGTANIAIPFANLSSKPTTLAGYGITDGALKSLTLTAGNGLTGGGTLEANRTFALGTPSTLTKASTNAVTSTSHTHAITTTTVGAANTIVATDASGAVRGNIIRIGANWTLELSGTELVFKYNGVIKQRMLSDGTILATGGITALSTE